MSAPVKLSELTDMMASQMAEMLCYVDKSKGEVVSLMDDTFRFAEEDKPLDGLPQWQQEDIKLARRILDDQDEQVFVPLLSKFDIDEYGIMRAFCYTVEDEEISGVLRHAIHGKGAFRRFKDAVHTLDLVDAWHAHQQAEMKGKAIAWCEKENVEYVDA